MNRRRPPQKTNVMNRSLNCGIITGGIFGLFLGLIMFVIFGFVGTGSGDTHHTPLLLVVCLIQGAIVGILIGGTLGLILGVITKMLQ
ncbi:MAG: hypothetical protein AB4062_06465 [Crocosphaera sp.]